MKRTTVRLMALLGVFAVGACGEEDPTGLTGDLSQAEAEDLASLVFSMGFFNTLSLQGTPAEQNMARVIQTTSQTVQTTVDCPLGGTVGLDAAIDISYDTDTGATSTDYMVTQTHSGCVGQSDGGRQFTLNGSPSIAFGFSADASAQSQSVDWSGGMTGAIAWATEGKSGTCTVDIDYSGSQGAGSTSFSVSGTVCGASVSSTYSVG